MNADAAPGGFAVTLRFHGDLPLFLRKDDRALPVRRILREKTSIKDAIEACGVPHPEVDLMVCNGVAVGFAHQLNGDADIDVFPVGGAPGAFANERLQACGVTSFVADGHLGKLVRDLRLLGIDVVYAATAADLELVAIASEQNRALLTRDRCLLMHAKVKHGYWPRSQNPETQTIEVLQRFDLARELRPYSRCLRCNAELAPVEKAQVFERLEPLTKIYYEDFRRCAGCGAVYWAGSHYPKLQARIERIMSVVQQEPR